MSPQKKQFYGDDLAWLHAQHYSELGVQAAPEIIRVLRAAGIRSGLVCDIGCGGGQLSASLLRAGYSVTGVDVSAAMVALARKQAPAAHFICGSILEVALPACSAAVAVGEVFNYLKSRAKMQTAFRKLFRALVPGGMLVFDIKEPPPRKLTRVSCRSGPDWAVIAAIEEDPAKQKLVRRIDSFRKIGMQYRRQTEIHRLGIYPVVDVRQMLEAVGFSVRVYPGYGKYHLGADRKVLLARKLVD